MPFTVKHALKHLARFNGAEGSCADDPRNLERLNRVRQLIYESPEDFVGTVEWAVICVDHCHHSFFLPESMETARATAVAHHPIPLLSKNYEFIDIGQARRCATGGGFSGDNIKRGVHFLHVNESRNRHPYFVDQLPPKFRIRVTGDSLDDVGTTITFNCRNSKNYPEVIRLTLNGMEEVISDISVTDILEVTKPITKGSVYVATVVGTDCPALIAEYSRRNENPRFAKYSVHGHLHRFHGTRESTQVVVFGKKRFFPYSKDDMDLLVDIESLQGLVYGYQALNATEAEDDQGFASKIGLMEKMLERADHNLEVLEPNETCNVHYQTATTIEHWP